MRVDDFDFTLPEDLIALRPARPRRSARMLVADGAGQAITVFDRLADHLRPSDLIVFNDTKVLPARLNGIRHRGDAEAAIEATLLKRTAPDEWRALAKPGKRLKQGDVIAFGPLSAVVEAKEDAGAVRLRFDQSGPALDQAVAEIGAPPLPPYIATRRQTDEADDQDYQTLFAAKPGAVAAPTASLHFEPEVMETLSAKGVLDTRVTLHVGGGTFLPIKVDDTKDHVMHAEWGEVTEATAEAVNRARRDGGRIIAAGTTALRLLETASDEQGVLRPWIGDTDIFITPGYKWRQVDGLITNFHLPRSTLFMLVSGFMGLERMQDIYAHAMKNRMRFYSYGDASLLWRA
ncbi:MAG: tRNA preQ1(34) S-adenosylmethionine ribosyltransferase-isomerase QueA [Pikeienuella sp.]